MTTEPGKRVTASLTASQWLQLHAPPYNTPARAWSPHRAVLPHQDACSLLLPRPARIGLGKDGLGAKGVELTSVGRRQATASAAGVDGS